MPRAAGVSRRVVQMVVDDATVSDQALLARHLSGDESAFAAIVQRHSRLVLGVCRRVLTTRQDAEDATQAVFVVLARQAPTAKWQRSIANWLYTTARRVALAARRAALRRAGHEARAPNRTVAATLDELTGRETLALLDDELDRLPPRYREPLVLCYLEGLSREETAARLGVPEATVKSQLDRGRKKLAAALEKRGLVAGTAVIAAVAATPAAACPPELLASVMVAAGGQPSPAVAALAQGVAVNTWMNPTLLGVLAVTAVSLGMAGFAPPPSATADEKPAVKAEKPGEKKDAKPEKPTSIGGTVTGPDGKLVNGASVFVGYYRTGGMWAPGQERTVGTKVATTDADGKFTADVPKDAPAYFWVYATKPGFGVTWTEPKYPNRTITEPGKLTLKMPADQPITGTVVGTEGKPVAGASVTVFTLMDPTGRDFDTFLKAAAAGEFGAIGQWDDPLHPPVELFRATTDADGKFEVKGVGNDRIVGLAVSGKGVARQSGMVLTRKGVDVGPLNQPPKDQRMVRLGQHPIFYPPELKLVVVAGYAVEGVVTDKKTGKPIAGVLLEVNTGHWDRVTTVSNKDGKYRLDGMTKGMSHHINVFPPKGVDVFPTWADVKEATGYQAVTLDFTLVPGAVFAGKVIDKETKQPLSASFQIIPTGDNDFAKKPEYETASRDMVWKGGGGTFRIVTLPGKSRVNVSVSPTGTLHGEPFHPYLGGQTLEIDLPETGEKEHVIEIERGKTAVVNAVDDSGKPVSGLVVAGITQTNQDGVEQLRAFKLPAADTKFTVFGLGEKEKRRVVVIQPEKKLAGSLVVTPDGDLKVTLAPLQPLRGTFTDSDDKPLAGLAVSIDYNVNGLWSLFRDHIPAWKRSATTDKDGKFEIPDAIPGLPFTFDIRKGDTNYRGAPRLGTQTVPAGKPLELDTRKLEEIQD